MPGFTEAEAKKKYCPLRNDNCIGQDCFVFRWTKELRSGERTCFCGLGGERGAWKAGEYEFVPSHTQSAQVHQLQPTRNESPSPPAHETDDEVI